MISSKKIHIISVILICIALAFTVWALIMQHEAVNQILSGEHVFSDKHKINYEVTDFYTDYTSSSPVKISLNGDTASSQSRNVSVDGSNITIRGSGTYVLSGKLENGSITVDSADNVPVWLILNSAHISSDTTAAIYVKQAEKVILSTAEDTENTLNDGDNRTDDTITAALYSKDDLTINGKGSLTVKGNYRDGIKCNDDLKITEGTITVIAADDGINANNYIGMLEADINIKSTGDAIKCEYTDDYSKGFAAFEKTTINIETESDGIYASNSLYNYSADVTISKCREGLESAYITINGGNIDIVSYDDGINATGHNSVGFGRMPMHSNNREITDDDIYLTINSGKIKIETSGDGIDSNGAISVNGGDIEVYGPENNGNSSLDFEYQLKIDGGSMIAAGSSGMAETPAENSTQNTLVFYMDKAYDAGSEIVLTDERGNKIKSASPTKKFDWVCISSADILTNGKYTLTVDGNEAGTAEVTSRITTYGNRGRSFGR